MLEREDEDDGLRCHLALAWTEATDEDVRSFVNTIPTRDGGTHELGMLAAVGTAVQRFMETHDLVKKGRRSSARTSARGSPPCWRSASASRSSRARPRGG